MKKLFYISLALIFCACGNKDTVNSTLKHAGSNRSELEKVLNHYSVHKEDSLKLKAARFLIENMSHHYTSDNENLHRYFAEIASINTLYKDSSNKTAPVREQYALINKRYHNKLTPLSIKPDVQYITADYLINNIDLAFNCWQNGEWGKHASFDQFCEYILPYRIGNEPLEPWREEMEERYIPIIEWVKTRDNWRYSTFYACTYLNDHIKDKGFSIEEIGEYKFDYPPSVLTDIKLGSCEEYTRAATFIMRACGMPVAIDYVIQWPFRSKNHAWNSLLSNDGKWYCFMGGERNPGQVVNQNMKKGKVYRKTFSYQENSLFHQNKKYREKIPNSFNTPFMKDVSEEYFAPIDVTIELTNKPSRKTKFAYLAVFNNKEWIPIQWAEIKRGKAIFEKMEHDIVYMPVYYSDNGIEAAAEPFILTIDNKIKKLTPDFEKHCKLHLERKYPRMNEIVGYSERMMEGKFEVAQKADFSDAVEIATIEEIRNMRFDSIRISPEKNNAFRFWRFISSANKRCNVAELEVFSNEKNITALGTPISSESAKADRTKEEVFDGDPLTFFESKQNGNGWVGLEFKEPVSIDKIRFLPRNDDNNIRIGDVYELVFWHDAHWNSLGIQIADKEELIYEQVPDNSLLLLHNHTRGSEERIFTVEGERTLWW